MCSDLFQYDPTDEAPPAVSLADVLRSEGITVIDGQTNTKKLIAGLDPTVADQLTTLVEHLAKVLMEECQITKEEAHKKIRWASHVAQGRR